MIPIPTTITISLISIFLTGYYTPINPAREWLVDKYISFCVRKGLYKTAELSLFLTCSKCLSFMICFLYTWDFPQAILCSMITLVIKWIIDNVTK